MTLEVVINACHGGFGVSNEAAKRCIKAGMTVTKIGKDGNYEDNTADFVLRKEGIRHNRYYALERNQNEFRMNPILVGVVKELGQKADGPYARLKVIDIPFDDENGWEIDEYDGFEKVVETHRSWS